MIKSLKQLLKRTFLYRPLKSIQKFIRHQRELLEWLMQGKPTPPPPYVKERILAMLAWRNRCKVFIETGTFQGDTVNAMARRFDKLYSIEIDDILYRRAKERFARNNKIEIIHGDSSIELSKLLAMIDRPALFWLDGHYSGGVTGRGEKDTPIFEELDAISRSGLIRSVVVIDDARCFGADPAYPTIDELRKFIGERWPRAKVSVKYDGIRFAIP